MKSIPGFPDYTITKGGRVWSTSRVTPHGHRHRGKWLRPGVLRSGYRNIVLYINSQGYTCYIHRLVLETFVGPCPEGMEVCHNNGNRADNRLENLRWDTRQENIQDAIKHGTHNFLHLNRKGEKNGFSKLTEDKVRVIRYLYEAAKFTLADLAWQFDVHRTTIGRIVNRKRWKHLYAKI